MIQIFNLTLGANESREVAIAGEYFELRNALFPITLIELLDRNGAVLSRLDNPEQSDFVRPGRFETVRITNGATAQTVKHFYGSGDAGSRRTSGLVRIDGTSAVSVVDGGKIRTLDGMAFAWANGVAGVAAKYALTGLSNPVASTKRVIIKRYSIIVQVASNLAVHTRSSVMLLNADQPVSSKLLTGAQPIARSGSESVAAVTLSPRYVDYVSTSGAASVSNRLEEPIVLLPGESMVVENITVAASVNASYEWLEEAI